MEALKHKVNDIKAKIARVANWHQANTGCKVKRQIQARIDIMEKQIASYVLNQDKLRDLDETAESEDREEYENYCMDLLAFLQEMVDKINDVKPQPDAASSQELHVKLPNIHLPTFSGNCVEYPSFMSLFRALIINNAKLTSNSEKLYYLKSYLRGEPLKMVEALTVTDDNFSIALDILEKRYSNKKQLVLAHYQTLLSMPSISKCNAQNLRQFSANTKVVLDALNNLGLSEKELFGSLIVYLLEQKLDYATKKAFEEQAKPSQLSDTNELFEFLSKRCVILENLYQDSLPDSKFSKLPGSNARTSYKSQSHNQVSLLSNSNSHQRFSSSSSGSNLSSHQSNHLNQTSHNNLTQNMGTGFQIKKCTHCKNDGHRIYQCQSFLSLPITDRINFVKQIQLCYNCLGANHSIQECLSKATCSVCHKKHHSLLHLHNRHNTSSAAVYTSSADQSSHNPSQDTQTLDHSHSTPTSSNQSQRLNSSQTQHSSSLSALSTTGSHILLATAKVHIYPANGRPITARALLDSGSQSSFITDSLATAIGGTKKPTKLHISGILNDSNIVHEMQELKIFSHRTSSKGFFVNCAVVPQITSQLPQVAVKASNLNIPSHLQGQLADEDFHAPGDIDLLLGADIYYELLQPGLHSLGKNLPTLVQTKLGWIISGTVPPQCLKHHSMCHHTSHSFHSITSHNENNDKLETLLENFLEQEACPPGPILSEDDELAETIFKNTTRISPDGRYQVDLPLIYANAHKELGDSFVQAKNRFLSLEHKLDKFPQLKQEYKAVFDEYLQLGHGTIVPLTLQNSLAEKYFVPHLSVIREHSLSTKMRVVFDFSAKSTSSLSLNDISLRGPLVQPPLFDILLRFRTFKFAITADITKMYRQVSLNPKFRFLQNVLWRNNKDEDLSCIELNTVSFGQKSAPYLACRVLKDIALKHPHLPLAQSSILSQTYVDDILSGTDSENELSTLHESLVQMLSEAHFELHKLRSNSSTFLQSIPKSDSTLKDMNLNDTPCKVLGLNWNPSSDSFQISTPSTVETHPLTKRKALSLIAQCYDPLGLVNPVIVAGKLIMQKLWALKLTWDQSIEDSDILNEWSLFKNNISQLSNFTVLRCIKTSQPAVKYELHGFCDASTSAYGCCIYLRTFYSDKTASSNLLAAKSKVAPIKKPLTIPKLELCAMVLLSSLYKRVSDALSQTVTISHTSLWSDSQVALSWIHGSPSKWTTFVTNRVTTIQEDTSKVTWKHIASTLNPADMLSRGKFSLETRSLWLSGPAFLSDQSSNIDQYDSFSLVVSPPEEKKHVALSTKAITNTWSSFIATFSNYSRLQRSFAYVLRFIQNCRHSTNKISGPLTPSELNQSTSFLIKHVQSAFFKQELHQLKSDVPISNKQIASLNPFLDNNQIIRVGGRLSQSNLPYEQRHPILLPSKNPFTFLLLEHEHKRSGHAGPQAVLHLTRLNYWPLDGLRMIKKIIHSCNVCIRFSAITSQQIMADLPKERVTPSRPFTNTGIDFGGPFLTKSSSLRKAPLKKTYIAVFVCFATKAIHLELVSDLSTEAFLAGLKRFIARRGLPKTIFSDNATNFTGANNYLNNIHNFLNKHYPQLQDFLTQSKIQWKFIPPRSPHWGGLWEAAIKSTKTHLLKILGTSSYTFEQLYTILTQVEAILNSRPLFPLSDDPNDLNPLTPGHFLIHSPLLSYPEEDVSSRPVNRLKEWQLCTQAQQQFWKRWSVDYLNRLQNRPKWMHPQSNIQLNDLVLLKDDDSPPMQWPLARVSKIFTGKDNKVRSVQILTKSGLSTRPITKIIVLPRAESTTLSD